VERTAIGSYPLGAIALERRERVPVIFHNADLLPGSSGGPLLDEDGHVVGINSRILVPGDRPEKFNYCAVEADRHSPGEDCINMAISSRAIAEAFGEFFGAHLPLEECKGIGSDPPLQMAEADREDADSSSELLTESAEN
jgi:S1-C subfamily serine protease